MKGRAKKKYKGREASHIYAQRAYEYVKSNFRAASSTCKSALCECSGRVGVDTREKIRSAFAGPTDLYIRFGTKNVYFFLFVYSHVYQLIINSRFYISLLILNIYA